MFFFTKYFNIFDLFVISESSFKHKIKISSKNLKMKANNKNKTIIF